MAVEAPFVWGKGGARLTPEQLAQRRAIEERMMSQGIDTSPVGHWTQGMARVAEAIGGSFRRGRLETAEKQNQAFNADLQKRAFGASSFPAAPTAGSVTPSPVAVDTSRAGSTVDFANAAPAGLDGYLASIRTAESNGNDQAKNPLSSATGRYQFIDSTWNQLAQQYPDLGLTPHGRNDPQQQERAIRAFTADNAKTLAGAGVPLTGGNLYAAHFLGAGDAQKVLTADPTSSISAYVSPKVISSNPFLRGMSVGDFSQWAASKGGANPIDFGGNAAPAQAPVQVASLDPSAGVAAATAPAAVDPYGAIPAIDGRGEDQTAKFRQWNSDPLANEAANLQSIDPGMRQVIERAKQLAGTNFTIGSGRRDPEMQKKAVEWGWSKTEDSDHLDGGAVDLWPVNDKGQVEFDRSKQQRVAAAMKQAAGELGISIEAGADWKKFQDMPHFALNGLRTPMEAPIPTARPGTQVASLDPSAGMGGPAPSPQQALESMVVGQSMPMPAQAPVEPQQRVAQALQANQIPVTAGGTAGALPPGQNGNSQAMMEALTSPYASDSTRRIAELMYRQQQAQQQAAAERAYEQQKTAEQRAYEATVRQEGYGREDTRNAQQDAFEQKRIELQERGLTPAQIREFEYSQNNPEFIDYQERMKKAGASTVDARNMGTIPQGYRMVYDQAGNPVQMEAIPGGPEDKSASSAAAAESRETSTGVITTAAQRAREALKAPGLPATGTLGKVMSSLPESNAAEVRRQVDVLKANAKVENLQAMRASSPTGGALGAVSDSESAMLAAKSGALDPDSPTFERDLEDYERTMLRIVHGPKVGDAIFEQSRPGASQPRPDASAAPGQQGQPDRTDAFVQKRFGKSFKDMTLEELKAARQQLEGGRGQ